MAYILCDELCITLQNDFAIKASPCQWCTRLRLNLVIRTVTMLAPFLDAQWWFDHANCMQMLRALKSHQLLCLAILLLDWFEYLIYSFLAAAALLLLVAESAPLFFSSCSWCSSSLIYCWPSSPYAAGLLLVFLRWTGVLMWWSCGDLRWLERKLVMFLRPWVR